MDLAAGAPNPELTSKFAKDFKVVVNFRPEKDVRPLPLTCKNADLNLLFGTKDEMVNNKEMMGSDTVPQTKVQESIPKAPPR